MLRSLVDHIFRRKTDSFYSFIIVLKCPGNRGTLKNCDNTASQYPMDLKLRKSDQGITIQLTGPSSRREIVYLYEP